MLHKNGVIGLSYYKISSFSLTSKKLLTVLINFVSLAVYEHLSDCGTYDEAIAVLENIYVKPVSEVFGRHKLKTRSQEPGESVDRYLESLKLLDKELKFKAVTADINRDEYIRDAFIDGLQSNHINQRLLENLTLSLEEAFTQARSLGLAQHQSQLYLSPSAVNAVVKDIQPEQLPGVSLKPQVSAPNVFFAVDRGTIGLSVQRRKQFAEDAEKRPFHKNLCRNSKCARDSSHDILKRHSSLQIIFGGEEALLDICSVAATNVEPAQLFSHLFLNCKPISIKSCRHTSSDEQLIDSEIQNLLKEGVIAKIVSPWRAQVMVVTSENHRSRMAVDYSQTINRYTELDAFPLPRIDDIVNKVASYKIYSRIAFRSAYYQEPISEEDKP
ncbi:hypothetical protein PR048_013389 [Dryococelus australis]|uniref:Polyprotein n=1 Tax=Dryococelus australis TaxID=614101 RepID=A0ABQ9HS15_9NEOP|nr:hypothetical protein PR048_013389 [Dryococelus australis]